MDAELIAEIRAFCTQTVARLNSNEGANYEQWLAKWQVFHACYLAAAQQLLEQAGGVRQAEQGAAQALEQIEAEMIVVEVMDQKTGRLFRRSLPVMFRETANGLILSGETAQGKASQIAFLSDTALQKIADVTGKGLDAPRCEP